MKTLNAKRWLGLSALLGSLLVVAGCSLAPTYTKPDVSAPAAFKETPHEPTQDAALAPSEQGTWKTAQPSEQVLRGEWWTVFNDPVLNDLVCDAYKQNLTLREAGYRILQARAQLGISVGEIFPQSQAMTGDFLREASSGATGSTPR